MLQICLGLRDSGEPHDETVRGKEGWILGRQPQVVEDSTNAFSASTDAKLADWLRWATESGEAPAFIRATAEAAFLADSPSYALLRPVLLKLKRRRPRE